jgi:hypothetical protein
MSSAVKKRTLSFVEEPDGGTVTSLDVDATTLLQKPTATVAISVQNMFFLIDIPCRYFAFIISYFSKN